MASRDSVDRGHGRSKAQQPVLTNAELGRLRLDVPPVMENLCADLTSILQRLTNRSVHAGVYEVNIQLAGAMEPEPVWIINPLEYAMDHHMNFIRSLKRVTGRKVLFVGMNSAPGNPTGIAFYHPNPMGAFTLPEDFLQWIECDPDMTAFSSKRFWEFIDHSFVTRDQFFEECFVTNYCPLIFMKRARNRNRWENIALDCLDDSHDPLLKALMEACNHALQRMITILEPQLIVAIGNYAEKRVQQAISVRNVSAAVPNIKVLRISHPASIAYDERAIPEEEKIEDWINEVDLTLGNNSVWREVTRGQGDHSQRLEDLEGILGVDKMESIGLHNMRESWFVALEEEFNKPYFKNLVDFVHSDRMNNLAISPYAHAVFNWTRFSDFEDVKVVIVAQDPYRNADLATGLAFSIENVNKNAPSLRKIFEELSTDLSPYGPQPRSDGDGVLTGWARKGVVLLNSVLTFRVNHENKNHHQFQDIGWIEFTDAVVDQISRKSDHVVFMLWGKVAREKRSCIDQSRHLVLECTHPSPHSASRDDAAVKPFLGCKHFSKANNFLQSHDLGIIDW